MVHFPHLLTLSLIGLERRSISRNIRGGEGRCGQRGETVQATDEGIKEEEEEERMEELNALLLFPRFTIQKKK
jgi:hypothetical protein